MSSSFKWDREDHFSHRVSAGSKVCSIKKSMLNSSIDKNRYYLVILTMMMMAVIFFSLAFLLFVS